MAQNYMNTKECQTFQIYIFLKGLHFVTSKGIPGRCINFHAYVITLSVKWIANHHKLYGTMGTGFTWLSNNYTEIIYLVLLYTKNTMLTLYIQEISAIIFLKRFVIIHNQMTEIIIPNKEWVS